MAVKRLKYGQVLERELAKGTSLQKAMKIARTKTTTMPKRSPQAKPLLKRKRKKKVRGKVSPYRQVYGGKF